MKRSLSAFALVASLSSAAFAQQKTVHVISIESEDAEDQADAFTAAFKSRMRQSPSWAPNDATNSLGPLSTLAKCPPKPDAACLGRIADQLKTDRFFWGTLQKAGKGTVAIDLHLFVKGKPDTSVKESFSDNLKDQNDDALRKIASRLFEKLSGATPVATGPVAPGMMAVHLKVNSDDGDVFVDGKKVARVEQGAANFDVPAGHHEVEVRAGDGRSGKRALDVTGETNVQVEVLAAGPPQPPPPPGKPFPVRKVIGFSVAGLGLVSVAIGIVQGVQFLNLQSKNADDNKNPVFQGVKDFCSPAAMPLAGPGSTPCKTVKDAETARTMEFVFLGIGGALVAAGAVIVLTDPGTKSSDAPAARLRLVPSIGPQGGGLGVLGTFE